jgi:hypothetical protein
MVVFYTLPYGKEASVQLPDSEHTDRPWRIHEIAPEFRLEDVWALPTPGGPDDFPLLIEGFATADPTGESSGIARVLWEVRWKLGEWFGWDDEDDGVGSRVSTLRDRLPEDLREAPAGPAFDTLPFKSLFMTDNEWAAEIANKTMHGVLHLGWVPDPGGGWHGQMAVLVKPNGRFGDAYMAAIRPFRHWLVYPPLMRRLGAQWQQRVAEQRAAGQAPLAA